MRVIYGGRKTGRTTTLIELAAEAEKNGQVCYIVAHSHKEAHNIAKRAGEKGLAIGFPLTYDEFLRQDYHGKNIHHLYIDNVELLLRRLSGIVPIEAITILKEEEEVI